MSLSIKTSLPEPELVLCPSAKADCGVTKRKITVSKRDVERMLDKVLELLALQGIFCVRCPKFRYKLYPLSDDGQGILEERSSFCLEVLCGNRSAYIFEISAKVVEKRLHEGGASYGG